jgi:hypothetical protein
LYEAAGNSSVQPLSILSQPKRAPQLSEIQIPTDQVYDLHERPTLDTFTVSDIATEATAPAMESGSHESSIGQTGVFISSTHAWESSDPLSPQHYQTLQLQHEKKVTKLNKSHSEKLDQMKDEVTKYAEEIEQMRVYIEQIENSLIEGKSRSTQQEKDHEEHIKIMQKHFDQKLEQFRSEAEEIESSHVLASQRREQRLTERMDKSIVEEQAKRHKLQIEIEEIRQSLHDQKLNSTKTAQSQEISPTAIITHHTEQIYDDEMPSDMIDEDELEYHHI